MKNKQATTPELNEVIKVLDQQLYEGFLLRQSSLQDFEVQSKKADFDVNKFQKVFEQKVHKWIESVASNLALGIDRWYNYYHFLKPYRKAIQIATPIRRDTPEIRR